ncbi:MAG: hypothetical protein ACXWPS_09400 [Ktedonobacteraceae bacterium]
MGNEQNQHIEFVIQNFIALVPGDKLVWDGTSIRIVPVAERKEYNQTALLAEQLQEQREQSQRLRQQYEEQQNLNATLVQTLQVLCQQNNQQVVNVVLNTGEITQAIVAGVHEIMSVERVVEEGVVEVVEPPPTNRLTSQRKVVVKGGGRSMDEKERLILEFYLQNPDASLSDGAKHLDIGRGDVSKLRKKLRQEGKLSWPESQKG